MGNIGNMGRPANQLMREEKPKKLEYKLSDWTMPEELEESEADIMH